MQQKTFSRGFAKGGATTAPAATSSNAAAPAATTGKKEWKYKPDHVGYLHTSKSGKYQMIKIEQDLVLEKGTMLILKDPAEEKAGLVKQGFISQEQADEQLEKTKFILAVVKILPKRDNV